MNCDGKYVVCEFFLLYDFHDMVSGDFTFEFEKYVRDAFRYMWQ